MDITLLEKLGDGAFADVWRAKDQLDREVAIKIIRPASLGIADALSHAKALARADHRNVVSVYSLEKIVDPDMGIPVDCVVMELLNGDTLTKRLSGTKFTLLELRKVGVGIIEGLIHIHKQGMAHGDLHSDNVMVVEGVAKIIDILYLNSLSTLSTEKKESRLRRDLVSLRLLLQQIIVHSEIDAAEATEFNNLLEAGATGDQMHRAFLEVANPDNAKNELRAVQHSFSRLAEAGFVEGEAYAAALNDETVQVCIFPLLKKIIEEKAFDPKHRHYVQAIWARLPSVQRSEVIMLLGSQLDLEIPKGRWSPGLRLLKILGYDSWKGLSKVLQLKLEGQIVNDVLAGHKDMHSQKPLSGGALGTYAISFWRHFQNQTIFADNLISLLRQNWYTQNYVASFFMPTIPLLAEATSKRPEFISGFRIALGNDAHLIKSKLEELPTDWLTDIKKV
jgi:tRNA A-37 threonylcarbamoyl transferase component Bud32